MKSNKLIVIFLIKFFGTYALLFLCYSYYLESTQQKTNVYACSPITRTVANQTEFLLNSFGYEANVKQHPDEVSVMLSVDNVYIARVVEGCNSISIIILFVSFIIAFSGKFKTTFFYLLFGCVMIYAVNLIRIVILTIGLYNYPWRREILHSVIFPLIIYGLVFLLWMFWVNRFVNLKPNND